MEYQDLIAKAQAIRQSGVLTDRQTVAIMEILIGVLYGSLSVEHGANAIDRIGVSGISAAV